jgi:hypothetical protein
LLLIRPFLAFSEVRHPLWHCTVFIQVLNGRINKDIAWPINIKKWPHPLGAI